MSGETHSRYPPRPYSRTVSLSVYQILRGQEIVDEHCHRLKEFSADCRSSIPSSHPCQTLYRSAFQIWIHVPMDRVNKATNQPKPLLQVVIEKKSMINLVGVVYRHARWAARTDRL